MHAMQKSVSKHSYVISTNAASL